MEWNVNIDKICLSLKEKFNKNQWFVDENNKQKLVAQ